MRLKVLLKGEMYRSEMKEWKLESRMRDNQKR